MFSVPFSKISCASAAVFELAAELSECAHLFAPWKRDRSNLACSARNAVLWLMGVVASSTRRGLQRLAKRLRARGQAIAFGAP
jgi:hypothetical protein